MENFEMSNLIIEKIGEGREQVLIKAVPFLIPQEDDPQEIISVADSINEAQELIIEGKIRKPNNEIAEKSDIVDILIR